MRKLTLLLLFIFSLQILNAQDNSSLNISESETFQDKVPHGVLEAMITLEDGTTCLIRRGRKTYSIDVFDKDLKKIHNRLINKDKRKEEFLNYAEYENKLKFITVYYPKKRERVVYIHSFDLSTYKYSRKEIFRSTVEKSGLFNSRKKRNTDVVISPNGEYIAMATDKVDKYTNSYLIQVFETETLKKVYSKSYEEEEKKTFIYNEIVVDNEANTFLLGKLYFNSREEVKENESKYKFVLYKINDNNIDKLDIEIKDQYISELVINQNNDKFQLFGFYSDKRDGLIKGGCSFTINEDKLSLVQTNNQLLPDSVYKDLFGDIRAERKKDKELSTFDLDYIITDQKGNTYLLAEEFYVTTSYVNTGMGGGTYQTILHYDDILILKFNNEGKVEWGRSIFKKATGPSYNAFLKNEELHVVLNTGKNLKEKDDGRTKLKKRMFQSTALFDITYDENGNVAHNKIQDNKGNNYYSPYFGTYNNGRFVMVTLKSEKKKFMILE